MATITCTESHTTPTPGAIDESHPSHTPVRVGRFTATQLQTPVFKLFLKTFSVFYLYEYIQNKSKHAIKGINK